MMSKSAAVYHWILAQDVMCVRLLAIQNQMEGLHPTLKEKHLWPQTASAIGVYHFAADEKTHCNKTNSQTKSSL